MPGIFLGSLHIQGIVAGIQVFFRVIEQDFVQNHEVSGGLPPRIPILMLNIGSYLQIVAVCRQVREVYFTKISIFHKFQVFFRSNYFFQVLALLSAYAGSHPPGTMKKIIWSRVTSITFMDLV